VLESAPAGTENIAPLDALRYMLVTLFDRGCAPFTCVNDALVFLVLLLVEFLRCLGGASGGISARIEKSFPTPSEGEAVQVRC
jgi:hypothetical protein